MIYKRILEALMGRIYWFFLSQKYGSNKEKCRYILFPSLNSEYNFWGIIMLPEFIINNDYEKIIIISSDERIITSVKSLNISNIFCESIKFQKLLCLIRYYALMDKSDIWTVVSVEEPYSTGAEKLLGKKGITYKEIVYYDIYKFSKNNINDTIKSFPFDIKQFKQEFFPEAAQG